MTRLSLPFVRAMAYMGGMFTLGLVLGIVLAISSGWTASRSRRGADK